MKRATLFRILFCFLSLSFIVPSISEARRKKRGKTTVTQVANRERAETKAALDELQRKVEALSEELKQRTDALETADKAQAESSTQSLALLNTATKAAFERVGSVFAEVEKMFKYLSDSNLQLRSKLDELQEKTARVQQKGATLGVEVTSSLMLDGDTYVVYVTPALRMDIPTRHEYLDAFLSLGWSTRAAEETAKKSITDGDSTSFEFKFGGNVNPWHTLGFSIGLFGLVENPFTDNGRLTLGFESILYAKHMVLREGTQNLPLSELFLGVGVRLGERFTSQYGLGSNQLVFAPTVSFGTRF